jgi:hypothetical protein
MIRKQFYDKQLLNLSEFSFLNYRVPFPDFFFLQPNKITQITNKPYIPVVSPLGAEARNIPLLVYKSTSTVGIPLLSRICLALIFVITEGTAFLI